MGMQGNYENFPLALKSVVTLSPQLAGGKAGERKQQGSLPRLFPAAPMKCPWSPVCRGCRAKNVCNGVGKTGRAYVFLSWSKSQSKNYSLNTCPGPRPRLYALGANPGSTVHTWVLPSSYWEVP